MNEDVLISSALRDSKRMMRADTDIAQSSEDDAAIEGQNLNQDGKPAPAEQAAAKDRTLDPALLLAQIAAFRASIQAGIGEVILAMLNLARYRDETLADLAHLVVEPMVHDCIAIARVGGGLEETVGITISASVSEKVDAKIREQIQARVFPVRLKAEDWKSGEICWLLDVIAPSQQGATAVLANFTRAVKDKPVRIHPIVSQLVDPAVLEKMKVGPMGEAEGKGQGT